MPDTGHLWAVGYDDVSRAKRVCSQIIQLAEQHSLILRDWAVAVRSADGSLALDGEPLLHPSGRGRLANFLASLALGAPPLTSAAVDIFTSRFQTAGCISDDFIREVKELMRPGTSVLFVAETAEDLSAILNAIRGLGGTVLKTNVDLEQAKRIQSTLASLEKSQNP